MKRIVILGAGFGGLQTALALSRIITKEDAEIVLVDRNSYQTYTPALYEVATAYREEDRVSEHVEKEFVSSVGGSVAFDLSQIVEGTSIVLAHDTVEHINTEAASVRLGEGGELSYDYLVVALGSTSAFFGVEGAREHCVPMKSIHDALQLREEVSTVLQKAEREMTVAVIGGGLTGFEVITEMCNFVDHLKKRHKKEGLRTKLVLIEAGETVLSAAPLAMRERASKRLAELGVTVMTGTRIRRVEPGRLYFADGGFLDTDVQMWSGGVEGHEVVRRSQGLSFNEKGQIEVDEFLFAKNRPNVAAIGDAAAFFDAKADTFAPATAWAAEQQAAVAARNIRALIRGEQPVACSLMFPGFVSSSGGKYAIAHLFGFTVVGVLAWLMKRLIDLKYLLSLYSGPKALSVWLRGVGLFARND